MFGWGEAEEKHDAVYGDKHEGSFSHELIAGAAGFAAMKAYNDHQEENGKPQSYELLKEILAGIAASQVDKLFETKGLDYLDKDTAKEQAVQQAYKLADEKKEKEDGWF